MLGKGLLKRAVPHACSAALMTPAMRGKVKSTVMEVDERVHTLTESFEPFAPEARPGDWLLDHYADRLHFDKRDPTQDKRPYLDKLIMKARADPLTVLAATDGSVPQSNQYQATSAAIIYKGHRELERTCYVSGRVTAPDAELNAVLSVLDGSPLAIYKHVRYTAWLLSKPLKDDRPPNQEPLGSNAETPQRATHLAKTVHRDKGRKPSRFRYAPKSSLFGGPAAQMK
ncbi:unnamed protein product [Cyclocybe aegerita]|uniref:Uncharacterized protein n=1 Tax=Cyclocybe aegerita TaxID=1973307 RepID=A0A8S0VQ71_CYCAE|nr:unnamed protein product [Cyclocybe aegerita]